MKNEDWRNRTIFLLDGAQYHQSDISQNFFQKKWLKIMISAPYSYNSAQIGVLFANLKNKEINP